jgi:hypothetical protein
MVQAPALPLGTRYPEEEVLGAISEPPIQSLGRSLKHRLPTKRSRFSWY